MGANCMYCQSQMNFDTYHPPILIGKLYYSRLNCFECVYASNKINYNEILQTMMIIIHCYCRCRYLEISFIITILGKELHNDFTI